MSFSLIEFRLKIHVRSRALRSHFTSGLLALTLASATLLASPINQSAAPTPRQDQPIRVGVPLVNLYATVLDKKKSIVPNLDQNNFRIFEDNVEQKISFFSREKTLPLAIGLLIDTSGSEANMIGAEQQAASEFLHRILHADDKAFVIAFDSGTAVLSDWTSDVPTLERAIRHASIGSGGAANRNRSTGQFPRSGRGGGRFGGGGGTHLYDAIDLASHNLMPSQTARRVLIVLTDATDHGSSVTVDAAVESAQHADTLIQMLVVYGRKRDANFNVAKNLAENTGGHAIDVYNAQRLQAAFDEISEELRTEYSLGYYPTNAKPDGTFRQLRLDITNKNYKAQTRKGYYARTTGN
jgi:VWFA-related protein